MLIVLDAEEKVKTGYPEQSTASPLFCKLRVPAECFRTQKTPRSGQPKMGQAFPSVGTSISVSAPFMNPWNDPCRKRMDVKQKNKNEITTPLYTYQQQHEQAPDLGTGCFATQQ